MMGQAKGGVVERWAECQDDHHEQCQTRSLRRLSRVASEDVMGAVCMLGHWEKRGWA